MIISILSRDDLLNKVRIGEFIKRGIDIKGIVHIGANDGYEASWYLKLGIKNLILIDPLPLAYFTLMEKFKTIDTVKIYNCAIGDKIENKILQITPGDGQGSSLLDMTEDHLERYLDAGYEFPTSVEVNVVPFDFIVQSNNLNLNNYNCLVIDVQGYEKNVLLGMQGSIRYFDCINIEVSKTPIYVGESHATEIDHILVSQGFRAVTPIPEHNDQLFVNYKYPNIKEFKIE